MYVEDKVGDDGLEPVDSSSGGGIGPVDDPGNPVRVGEATYYHPSLHGETMADGTPYNQWDPTIVASNAYPLGTTLRVTYTKSITVTVRDWGLLVDKDGNPILLDLSRAAMHELIGSVEPGVIEVEVQEVP
jgi:rare lipoprotein A (peptidoglycan hydrolase)